VHNRILTRYWLKQVGFQLRDRAGLRARHVVDIPSQREVGRVMAEDFADRVDVHAQSDEVTGRAVPEIMKSNSRDLGPLDDLEEVPVDEIADVEIFAVPTAENEAVVLIAVVEKC